ncbi:Ltp family lipoprotein [Actinoplanes sp. TRM 88003]|uniref:Ltp family lipoprotein n=1 Tax=Paractinoplanes aksuensis TaxID=2939490 RepID=A0ABT1DU96_9ACTN|nr:Ltp family lipoprotein [Actinoplanes aksuensis]MCO8274402.1 Ltp family lipoprotein [Actinoplanes aksuensis]
MSPSEYGSAPKKMGRGKKIGLVGGGVLAGLLVIGMAAGGGDEAPAEVPVAEVNATVDVTTAPTNSPNQEAIDKLQLCIDMTAGTRAYDPELWDVTLCGDYKGSLVAGVQPTTEPVAESTAEAVAEPAVEPTKELTVAQENAVDKAGDYLASSSFSRSGLIKQLKFEGFSTKDATFGVDAQKANWNQQAAGKAADYLDSSAFSRSGLVKQLKFEGFSTKQANYGVAAQKADWNEQAAKKAADYLDSGSFSRSGLVSQLKFEGFTTKQANYGVKKVGL